MRKLAILLLPLTLAACVEPDQYATIHAVGGDKTQGVMQMSTTYDPASEKLNWMQADMDASRRCRGWDYKTAEAFDNTQQICLATNADGSCRSMQVTRTYQCMNHL